MFNILSICFLIISVLVLIIGVFMKFKKTDETNYLPSGKFIGAGICLLIIYFIFNCLYIVPANSVGVRYSVFNGTSKETLNEGIVLKAPLDKIYLIPTTVQERTIDGVTVQTKDAQFLSMSVNIKFQVNKSNAFTVFQRYTTIDNLKENIIANYAQKAIESVVTKYNVIDALGEQKNNIYLEAEKTLKEMLANEGVDLVAITIKDMDAGDAIEKAIQDEAVAKKAVETAKQLQEKAQIEAETKLIEAQGEAEANAVKTKQLTDEILTEMWINKWDGKLPTVSGDNQSMIDISSLLEDKAE